MAVSRRQLEQLRAPFALQDIEWRVQQAGEKNGKVWAKVIPYLNVRAVQDRLDDVCGPELWRNAFHAGPAGGVLCGLSIFCEIADADGAQRADWITKWDGAENTDVEKVKGGLSSATKRAGTQWGIGRYMRDLGAAFAKVHEGGRFSAKLKEGKWYKWDPPDLPEWAQPKAPAAAGDAQLARIDALLPGVDEKTAASVRKRVAAGLTAAAADEAIAYLEKKAAASRPRGAARRFPDVFPVAALRNQVVKACTTPQLEEALAASRQHGVQKWVDLLDEELEVRRADAATSASAPTPAPAAPPASPPAPAAAPVAAGAVSGGTLNDDLPF